MNSEVISAIIIGVSTIIAAVIVGVVASLITNKVANTRESLRKLYDDWEFLYRIEELLLEKLKESNGKPKNSTKIETRNIVENELSRSINIDGLKRLKRMRRDSKI